jgi:hypothetical protein
MNLYLLLSMCCKINSDNKIKNINNPSCTNCIHFRPSPPFNENGKCSMFGYKNLVTNEVNYNLASICREDKNKCGLEGKFYEELKSHNKIIRKITYFIKNNESRFIILFILLSYSFALYITKTNIHN